MIKIVKQVIFKDRDGNVLRVYEIGDMVKFTAKDDDRGYFVTAMGGIFFDEAVEVI